MVIVFIPFIVLYLQYFFFLKRNTIIRSLGTTTSNSILIRKKNVESLFMGATLLPKSLGHTGVQE